MKIKDLFELSGADSYRRVVSIEKSHSGKDTKETKVLGKGSQGIAIERTKKTNMVTKVFGINSEYDGFLSFVRLAQRRRNIHFPRFENLRIYDKPFISSDVTFKKTAAVDMEKLVPLDNEKVKDAVEAKLKSYGVLLKDDKLGRGFSLDRINADAIKDAHFKHAVQLVRELSNFTDMGLRNIMVRVTSIGPQIVLMDPIYDPQ
jgi:hypothetical protein